MIKYKISEYARIHDVTQRTVWNWIKEGKLTIEHTKTGRVRIIVDNPNIEQVVAIYANVSKQNESLLEEQVNRLVDYCTSKEYKLEYIVKDIGDYKNITSIKFKKLLLDKSIKIIIVDNVNILKNYGFPYIKALLSMQNRCIEFIN